MAYISFVLLCVLGTVLSDDKKYTGRFENIEINELIRSDRLLRNYVNCFLDRGKCTPEGADVKRIIPDALQTSCGKCTDMQKEKLEKVLDHLIENKHDMFKEIQTKFDPDGHYLKDYEEKKKPKTADP